MLIIYQKQFNEIMACTKGKKRKVLLSNIMSQMEHFYKLSMVKEIFESETDDEIKQLYLNISKARKL